MSYPNIWLTHQVRRVFMLFLIASFFIISPIIILYTIGYRYDAKEHLIKQTGVLTLDIQPKDSSVFIDNILVKKEMPFELANRAPGFYNVRIEKDGYYKWDKKIEIKSKETTHIKNFELIRHLLPTKKFQEMENITKLSISSDGKYLLFSNKKNKNNFEVFLYSIDKESLTPLLETKEQPILDFSPYDLTALIEHSDLISNMYRLELFNSQNIEKRQIFTISKSIINIPYKWIKQKNSSLLTFKENKVVTTFGLEGKGRLGLAIHEIIGIDPKLQLWEYDQKERVLISSEKKLPMNYTISEILEFTEDIILARTPNGILVYNIDKNLNGEHEYMGTIIPINNILYNNERNEWLGWSNTESWKISSIGTTELLNRKSNLIQFLYPINELGTYATIIDNSITISDPIYYTEQKILSAEMIESIGINKKERKIFFLGTFANKHNIYELEY